ncbi:fibronectin type III domain protein [Hydrogenoanaerobacterium saccharovorans]|uniref:Fibronectin type III domain-containing protein n=1 Tax=Hydrogenoanaerobacterium saccharovorans TaxID=474960 RepID=A0A1H8E199_9FIRM|nr:glycoside hydrolase N-terminal domain-containing protein [Hydrogenoanaerobacterium saccharovorans]RPF42071.1 fibronectin type III domain protein [Hydrogenoanaerobacterium saccharovorans]SEN12874.1 Fibronectin type III domain-containing protein [Hydrogenoanaerobacterium saccharovorans]
MVLTSKIGTANMKSKLLKKLYSLVLVFALIFPVFSFPTLASAVSSFANFQAERAASDLRLWYDTPTEVTPNKTWQTTCLPIGNGYMGAMLAGQIKDETIQFNEKTLWTGGPSTSRPDYKGGNKDGDLSKALKKIQSYLLKGDQSAAAAMRNQLTGISSGYGAYQNFGWINITHKFDGEAFDASQVQSYARDLELNTGTASTSFEYKNVGYIREYFMSYPDHVMVIRQRASQEGALNMDIGVSSAQNGANVSAIGDTVTVKGRLSDNQLRYEAQMKVIPIGGMMKVSGSKLTVTGANEVVILMSAATDYENNYPTYRSGIDPHTPVEKHITEAAAKEYEELYENHLSDYQGLFGRVSLNLGNEHSGKTTKKLLDEYKAGKTSRELEVLLFQYGRYMTIGSSRDGSLPSNLQGVWNDSNNPQWSSDYHINVNLQMNYWPVYSTNLAECATPLINYVESLRVPGRITAKTYMGITSTDENPANGFTANTQNTPFGWTCPGWDFDWGWSPAAVPWILQNVWEHYEYVQDQAYLRSTIYPIMREQARFYQQYLILNPQDGKYYSAPAYSPEHGPLTLGNVYEHVLVKQLLEDTITASEILDVDEKLRAQWRNIADNLRTEEIGTDGQLKEWFDETAVGSMGGERTHRHISHLLGLYPGDSVSVETPELLKAAEVSLNLRKDVSTGWAMAQRISAWARMQDGNRTHKLIRNLFNNSIYENLFDTHPPFQIDGNFGYTAGVAEMLVQSNLGYIQPLPAIPDVWANGSVKGLVVRGNFEVAINWSDKIIDNMSLLSKKGGKCTLKYNQFSKGVAVTCDGEPVKVTAIDETKISFDTQAGKTYSISMTAPKPDDAPKNLQASRIGQNTAKISWSPVAGATYEVYRKDEDMEDYILLTQAPIADSVYEDTDVHDDIMSVYRVRALKSGAASAFTEDVELKKPETGLVDDRDERLQYTGNWGDWSDNAHHFGTVKFIEKSNRGDSVSLTFIGTGVAVFTPTNNNYSRMEVWIDGVQLGTFSMQGADEKRVKQFEKLDLPLGMHEIKLISTGDGDNGSNAKKVEFDAFEVFNSGDIKVDSVSVSSVTGATLLTNPDATMQMKAVIAPEDAENKSVNWSLEGDREVASISESGLLKAGTKNGTVTVTATSRDGSGNHGSIDITVMLDIDTQTTETIVDNKDLEQGVHFINSPNGQQWQEWSDGKHYNGSIHFIEGENAVDAKIVYTFMGTGIDIVTPLNDTFGSTIINIDGTDVATVELTKPNIPKEGYAQQTIYSKRELERGEHTITLTLIERNGKIKMEMDCFKIYDTVPGIDKTALGTTLQKAENELLKSGYYSPESFESFRQAVSDAVTIMNDLNVTEQDVLSKTEALQAAMDELVEVPDTLPPTKPVISISGLSKTTVRLHWKQCSDARGIAGYEVYKDGKKISGDTPIADSEKLSHYVRGLLPGRSYRFKVRALDVTNLYTDSEEIEITTVAIAQPNTVFINNITSDAARVNWEKSAGHVTEYAIYLNGLQVGVVNSETMSYDLTGLTPQTTYKAGVTALEGTLESLAKETEFTTIKKIVPDPEPDPKPDNGSGGSSNRSKRSNRTPYTSSVAEIEPETKENDTTANTTSKAVAQKANHNVQADKEVDILPDEKPVYNPKTELTEDKQPIQESEENVQQAEKPLQSNAEKENSGWSVLTKVILVLCLGGGLAAGAFLLYRLIKAKRPY